MVKADILGLFLALEENRSSIFQYDVAIQFSSVAQSCPTLCDPMDCSTPGLPVYYQHLEFIQTPNIDLKASFVKTILSKIAIALFNYLKTLL